MFFLVSALNEKYLSSLVDPHIILHQLKSFTVYICIYIYRLLKVSVQCLLLSFITRHLQWYFRGDCYRRTIERWGYHISVARHGWQERGRYFCHTYSVIQLTTLGLYSWVKGDKEELDGLQDQRTKLWPELCVSLFRNSLKRLCFFGWEPNS